MDGVIILNQTEVVIRSSFAWDKFFITIGIVALFSLFISSMVCLAEGDFMWSVVLYTTLIATLIFGLLFGVLMGAVLGEPIETVTEYQVTITDDVSMTDFMTRYEIIEQEGLIYTVRERN